jgi:hypothetical protein
MWRNTMLSDPVFRRTIIGGVVASLVVLVVIQPTLNLVVPTLLDVVAGTFVGFENQVYKNAALGQRNYVDVMTIVTVFTVLIVFPILAYALLTVRKRVASNETLRLRLLTISRFGFPIFAIFGLISAIYLGVLIFADLQYNTSFSQRLSVLAPAISDQDEEDIRAMWASMESRSDYDRVNQRLEELAQGNSIELPEPLLR